MGLVEPSPDVTGRGTTNPELGPADAELFAVLYDRYRVRLFRFCYSRTHNRACAEDLVHDVFAKAYADFPRFDRARPFWPWLLSIALRHCVDAHRRSLYADVRLGDFARMHVAHSADSVEDIVLSDARREHLERTIAELPERQRAALQLFAVDGWTYAQIADHFGSSVSMVKSLILRARTRLRDSSARLLGGLGGGLRTLQSRVQGLLARLEAAVAACAEGLSACVQAITAGSAAAAVLVVVVSGHAVLAPVDAGKPAEPPPPRPSPSSATTAIGTPSGTDPEHLPVPVTARPDAPPPSEVVEPVTRPYQAAAERTAHEAVAPVLYDTPDDDPRLAWNLEVVISPGYEQDRTIFAARPCCDLAPLLLVSRDGGASWQRRRALGLGAVFQLLLPPAYPRDGRIFAFGRSGLQLSRDDGETFETLLPDDAAWGFRTAAMSPAFNAGDPSILLLSTAGDLLHYRDDTGVVRPVPLPGDVSGRGEAVAYDAADEAPAPFVVLTRSPVSHTMVKAARCRLVGALAACEKVAVPDLRFGTFGRPTTPATRSGALLLPGGFNLLASLDGGRSFRQLGSDNQWISAAAAVPFTEGRSLVVARSMPTALARTDDGGTTWQPLTVDVPGFEWGANAVAVTPTGRIIASGVLYGLACSEDGGRTWATVCPTPDMV